MCVAECPKKNYVYLEDTLTKNKSNLICQDGVDLRAKVCDCLSPISCLLISNLKGSHTCLDVTIALVQQW